MIVYFRSFLDFNFNTSGTRYFEHRLNSTDSLFRTKLSVLWISLKKLSYLVVPISNSAISNYSLFRTEFSKIFGPLTEIALVISNFWKLKKKNTMTIKLLEKRQKQKTSLILRKSLKKTCFNYHDVQTRKGDSPQQEKSSQTTVEEYILIETATRY